MAQELYCKFSCFNAPPEMALAKNKLEESVMWAVKGVANWCKEHPQGLDIVENDISDANGIIKGK